MNPESPMKTLSIALLALALALALAGCGSSPEAGKGTPGADGKGSGKPERRFPVAVAAVTLADITYEVRAPGSLEAFERIAVPVRVAGIVDRIAFREGDRVTPDIVLAEVDVDRYRLRADAARGELAGAEAAAIEARAGLDRRTSLAKSGSGLVAAEELASWQARVDLAQALVAQRKADFALADLEAGWSKVRAPADGQIEERLVRTGQRVEAGTAVATVLRRDPLLVRFHVGEADAARLKTGQICLLDVSGRATPATAAITHVAGSADAASRQVAVVAEVAASDAPSLRPGTFAQVRVPLASASHPAIPATAVRSSERGFLAYVVVEGKAVERVLSLGLRTPDGRVEVLAGLSEGEALVVRGGEALRTGATVDDRGAVAADKPGDAPVGGGAK